MTIHQFNLRVPVPLWDEIGRAAVVSHRSIHAEMVWRLQESFRKNVSQTTATSYEQVLVESLPVENVKPMRGRVKMCVHRVPPGAFCKVCDASAA